jgi:hypothetical protein
MQAYDLIQYKFVVAAKTLAEMRKERIVRRQQFASNFQGLDMQNLYL